MPYAEIEGWYKDPFGKHAARWFSDGTPTALARDAGGVTSQDVPPSRTDTGELDLLQTALPISRLTRLTPIMPKKSRPGSGWKRHF